jgi:rhodanese-related sulfurtransferase
MTPLVSPPAASAAHQVRTGTVLDVREPHEIAGGHVPGAHAIPLSRLPFRLSELRRDEHYLVVCESGNRSREATAYLRGHGYDAHSVAGGMSAWRSAGLPVRIGLLDGPGRAA